MRIHFEFIDSYTYKCTSTRPWNSNTVEYNSSDKVFIERQHLWTFNQKVFLFVVVYFSFETIQKPKWRKSVIYWSIGFSSFLLLLRELQMIDLPLISNWPTNWEPHEYPKSKRRPTIVWQWMRLQRRTRTNVSM